MIEREELCISHLENLHRTGGEARIKSNTSNDPNRELVYIELSENGSYFDIGRLGGKVIGLELDYKETVLDSECVEYGCLFETGVWTTATKTPVSRLNGSVTEYWVRGPLDGANTTYVVDIGYIYTQCSETSIREENVPLKWDSSFRSVYSVPSGIKFVKLRRITPTQSRELLYHMGKYESPDNLSRHQTGYLLDYKYDDQKVDLEELAFSFSSLLTTTYYRPKDNRLIFRDYGYVDNAIETAIKDNLSRLSRLLDLDPTSRRFGSIPRYPATYSEPSQIYGTAADVSYEEPNVLLIEEGCLEDGCMASNPNRTLISREVNNRAMAWLLSAYSTHRISYSDVTYIPTITSIGTYLIDQMDMDKGLVREGWTHNNIYILS